MARFLQNLASVLQDLPREFNILEYFCKNLDKNGYLAKFFWEACKKCITWKILARNVVPGRMLQEIYLHARILQGLHYLARISQKNVFGRILQDSSKKCTSAQVRNGSRFLKAFYHFGQLSTPDIGECSSLNFPSKNRGQRFQDGTKIIYGAMQCLSLLLQQICNLPMRKKWVNFHETISVGETAKINDLLLPRKKLKQD